LTYLLALFGKDPKLGHPMLEEFVDNLRTPAGGQADEAVEQALNLVRNGDRTQLLRKDLDSATRLHRPVLAS
jgi:hypothetical protein